MIRERNATIKPGLAITLPYYVNFPNIYKVNKLSEIKDESSLPMYTCRGDSRNQAFPELPGVPGIGILFVFI